MVEPQLEASAILEVLNRHRVDYVIIGAFAAIAQRVPIPATRDIDLTPDTTVENLTRLSDALRELNARIRVEGINEGLPFDHNATSLGQSTMWNLICKYGEFDLCFFPSAFAGGYRELVVNARQATIEGIKVPIAHLSNVIASKEAAGRSKDLQMLPTLLKHYRSLTEKGEGKGPE